MFVAVLELALDKVVIYLASTFALAIALLIPSFCNTAVIYYLHINIAENHNIYIASTWAWTWA